ncbi:MAG TPA: ChuX/HutX family heme-like substrate-binding protein [Terrimicrobiaceae bacterium]|nr:ChuX/HutX family heme-like substrate-binding protein [Terrimicrobiaceae bacterium]
MKTETTETLEPLKARWEALREQKPKLRIRDAAAELGVSEAELLATGCGANVTRLAGDWTQVIKDLTTLGRVMCLTRNEHAVHERYGEFLQTDFFHGMGQVVGPDIDLRLFLSGWHHGFAVTDMTPDGERQSLQFFDASGEAVHKVYLQKESNYGGYGVLINKYRSPDQSTEQSVVPTAPPRPELPDAEIDTAGFQKAWLEMKDTHAFFVIMQQFRVAREQALRLAPEGYARRVSSGSTRRMLEAASASGTPIMVFIGNRGCLQIHTGAVKNIKMFGDEWLNVLDEDFNMHLRDTAIASAWVVRKPTVDGDVTSLELFDAKGNNVVIFFGKRKPGEPEDAAWRSITASLS